MREMEIQVRYRSRGGNTEKLARAIGKAVAAEVEDCRVPVTQATDLLFLGGSVYGFDVDEQIKSCIESLDPALVKCVAVFGSSAIVESGNNSMIKLLRKKNIPVMPQHFHCFGRFLIMHPGRPNERDCNAVADFARKVVNAQKHSNS